MRVTIQKILPVAGDVLDVTDFLDENERQVAIQELEFNAFQRTMPDIQVSLSDLDGTMTAFFSGIRGVDVIQCDLYDDTGRRRFLGYVENTTLTFLLRDRYAKFTAFSGLKRFWERAKSMKFYTSPISNGMPTNTLGFFFLFQSMMVNIRGDERLFDEIDLGDFEDAEVRGYDTYHGTLQNLDPETTWYDFLTACSIFFNAEFYIDPESRNLRMVHRISVMNDRQIDLDPLLCDDEEIEAVALDANRVDYVKSFGWYMGGAPIEAFKPVPIETAAPPLPQYGLSAGTHYYCVVYFADGQPSMLSEILAVTLPTPPSGYNWKMWLKIPAHPSGVGERKVYRSDPNDPTGTWYMVYSIAANDAADKVISDSISWSFLWAQDERPWVERKVGAWYSFDELTGVWTQILDAPKGKNTPSGHIFDIIPELHFMNPYNRSERQTDDPYNVFEFFMQQFNIQEEATRIRWADLFRTRRVVKCKVTGIDYEVGDSVVSTRGLFPNDLTADKRLVIRKAACDLVDNTSQLELVTV